jgi:hypothetical protein
MGKNDFILFFSEITASGIDSDAQNLSIDTGLSRDLKTRNIIETPSPVSSTGTPYAYHHLNHLCAKLI